MRLSQRSKLSLCQFLGILPREELRTLLLKHGVEANGWEWERPDVPLAGPVRELILASSDETVSSLLDELTRTRTTVRNGISPRYRYDERWDDLLGCLELDGYVAKGEYGNHLKQFIPVDPTIAGQEPIEDDLTKALKSSGLPTVDGILSCLDNSTIAFCNSQNPDFNAALNNARVAMESIARDIAESVEDIGPYDPGKWGSILSVMKAKKVITEDQEKGLAGVYRFLSPGSHRPQVMTEREYVRLARHLTVSMAFFLLKLAR